MGNFKEILIELFGKLEIIRRIKEEKGENFNIFSILGMERLEVQAHSAFIYELINTKGTHNQGDLFINLFIKYVLKIEDYKNILNVKREDLTADNRRIDFTIETEDYQIGIEMKIDAIEQKNQLIDYFEELDRRCKENQEVKLFYLTLNGREASKLSTKGELKGKKNYTLISFELEIYNWIYVCIEKSVFLPLVRENLVQYSNIIKKITGHTSKEVTMEVEKIINNPKMAEAATVMAQNIGFVWAKKEANFWDNLTNLLSTKLDKSWEIEEPKIFWDDNKRKSIEKITDSIYNHRKDANKEIALIFKKTINKKNILLRFYEFNTQNKPHFQLHAIDNILIDELAKKLDLNRTYGENRYGYSKIKVNFYGKDVNDPTYDIFDDEKLDKLVNESVDEIEQKIIIIEKYFKNLGDES